jgi:TolA-binding protein
MIATTLSKILLAIISFTLYLYATPQNATKDDIKMLIHQMDKRFEQVDKRFEQVDKRLELMQQQMDKRFEQVDKRFEQVDKHFEEAHQLSMTIIYIIIALFGFIMWDRRSMMSATKKEIVKELEPELVKKADKNILDRVIAIIEEMAKKDKEVEAILTKHHLRLI